MTGRVNKLSCTIQNVGPDTAYFGDDTVTVATGYKFSAGSVIGVDLFKGDSLWAIAVVDTTASIHVLEQFWE